MKNNIGLFWLKEDFRISKNLGLSTASKNHEEVVVFYLYKKKKFENQEAQKWWISKSLKNFKNKLDEYKINLEIIEVENYKSFFDNLFLKKNFSIYWNKTYEPKYLQFDKYLISNLKKNKIEFNILTYFFNTRIF